MNRKMSHAWHAALTSQFPAWECSPHLDRFNVKYTAQMFHLSIKNAERLSTVASFWYYTLEHLHIDDTLKHRLQQCTMRFSSWCKLKYKKKDGTRKEWNRKLRACGRAKICPWCRAKIVLHVYANLSPLANSGRLAYILASGDPKDRKKISRAPGRCIAAIRGITYPHSILEPVFQSAFFMKAEEGSPADPCDKDTLKMLISTILAWPYDVIMGHKRDEYLELMQGTRLYSLNV